MSSEILARWQFGITTVYHFFFVPLTIALSMIVAIFQTLWYKRRDIKFLKLTKFYGKLLLINFAMGVVTGIVQEFQFGMNWSEYSRFVGDIFGAPLALEALLAFFLESTFLGLWIFGWDRLPKKLHLMSIWLAAIGTAVSAIFILAANSFMQYPVGAKFNPATGRAELADFAALFTNPVFLTAVPHTIASSWMLAGGFVAGIAGWHLSRLNRAEQPDLLVGDHAAQMEDPTSVWRWAAKFGAWVLIVAGAATMLTGDFQGKVITNVQPMKMAAAEGLQKTGRQGEGAPFSIVAGFDDNKRTWAVEIPKLLSILATNDPNAEVKGIDDLNQIYTEQVAGDKALGSTENELGLKPLKHAPLVQNMKDDGQLKKFMEGRTNFTPNVPVAFWSFRLMIAAGGVAMLIGIAMLLKLRKGGMPAGGKVWNAMMWLAPLLPLLATSLGWIFAEMGRQPWIVYGAMPTLLAVSPTVPFAEVLISMIIYTLLYGGLAVIELTLMWQAVRKGMPVVQDIEPTDDDDAPLSFAY